MESTPNSSPPFDLNLASVEALVERFPDLGLFSAEDVVAWREKNGPITTVRQLVDELGLPEDVAVALLRVAHTETMAPTSGEFKTSIFPGVVAPAPAVAAAPADDEPIIWLNPPPAPPPADEEPIIWRNPPPGVAATAPEPVKAPEPEPVKAAPPEPAPVKEPEPEPVKAPAPVKEPEPVPVNVVDAVKAPSIVGSEARLAARLGIEHEEARASRAAMLERTGVNRAAIDAPAVAVATEQDDHAAEATSERPKASPPRKTKRALIMPLVVTAALIGNAALGGFLLQVRAEAQGVKAPVAQLTGEMHGMQEDQAQTRTELAETKSRLEKQATKLETTIDRVEATEARQRETDRTAKDAAKAEAREVAALTARLGRVEGRTEKATFKLDEAIKIIDSVQGKPSPAVDEDAPVAVAKKKSPPIHDGAPSWQSLTDSRH